MIRAGDSIENPVTGERLVFHKTSRETGGQAVVVETFVQPNGFVAAAHLHPSQEERFEIVQGSVGFKVGGEKLVAGPGRRITVPAGTPHKFWNAGDDVAQFVCEIRPALQFEQLIETMFSLAADGKTNRKGMPNPLRLAVIANAHFDTCSCRSRRRSSSGLHLRAELRSAACSVTARPTSARRRRRRRAPRRDASRTLLPRARRAGAARAGARRRPCSLGRLWTAGPALTGVERRQLELRVRLIDQRGVVRRADDGGARVGRKLREQRADRPRVRFVESRRRLVGEQELRA